MDLGEILGADRDAFLREETARRRNVVGRRLDEFENPRKLPDGTVARLQQGVYVEEYTIWHGRWHSEDGRLCASVPWFARVVSMPPLREGAG